VIRLGVNIDHVATLRQARQAAEPDPVWAAALCELAGAHNITVHLREDRRHIQDRDLELLRGSIRSKLNLELANVPGMLSIALRVKPDQVTLVPERRQELTTEGGLDVRKNLKILKETVKKLKRSGIAAGFFIDSDPAQIEAAHEAGAEFIEFHTGPFANAQKVSLRNKILTGLFEESRHAHALGMKVHAGHGLHYLNIHLIVKMPHLEEVNIGHAIISRAVFVGLEKAVKEMLDLMNVHSDSNLR
jgi:pyridoxine 5-phosphate synthase